MFTLKLYRSYNLLIIFICWLGHNKILCITLRIFSWCHITIYTRGNAKNPFTIIFNFVTIKPPFRHAVWNNSPFQNISDL